MLDKVHEEFLMYQIEDLPQTVLQAGRIDVAWHLMSQLKDVVTGLPKFQSLAEVMKGILTMYHSNADCERLFSMVRKNKTDFRSSMKIPTLSNLLTHKTMMNARSQVCHSIRHMDELLKKAKSATYLALNSQQESA